MRRARHIDDVPMHRVDVRSEDFVVKHADNEVDSRLCRDERVTLREVLVESLRIAGFPQLFVLPLPLRILTGALPYRLGRSAQFRHRIGVAQMKRDDEPRPRAP
jgi:hypothetical protein